MYLAVNHLGGLTGLHGQQLVGVTQFLVRVRVGLLHISQDEVIVVNKLGEGLAHDRVGPVGPEEVHIQEVPVTSHLVVDQ